MTKLKRAVQRRVLRRRSACFACGALTRMACPGHEYGGVILVWQVKRWAPTWLVSWVGVPSP